MLCRNTEMVSFNYAQYTFLSALLCRSLLSTASGLTLVPYLDNSTTRNHPCQLTWIASNVRAYTGQPTTDIESRNMVVIPRRRASAAGSPENFSWDRVTEKTSASREARWRGGASSKGARRNHGIQICASAGTTRLEAQCHRRRTWEQRLSGRASNSSVSICPRLEATGTGTWGTCSAIVSNYTILQVRSTREHASSMN
jgi:hypothetical protein